MAVVINHPEFATDLVSTISANENKGNDICATVIQCQQNFNAHVPTVHAILEQSLLEHAPVLPLPLSHDDCFAVICDEEELCESSLANYMPQLDHDSDTLNSESEISAANNHVMLLGSSSEEMRLLSSLNILGYIEFDVLCNLSTLKKNLCMNLELPCLSRNTFHAIGQREWRREIYF